MTCLATRLCRQRATSVVAPIVQYTMLSMLLPGLLVVPEDALDLGSLDSSPNAAPDDPAVGAIIHFVVVLVVASVDALALMVTDYSRHHQAFAGNDEPGVNNSLLFLTLM